MTEQPDLPESLADILKRWTEAGPSEDAAHAKTAAVDVFVYLNNGSSDIFYKATVTDIGSRVVITEDKEVTVFPEASIRYYTVQESEADEDEE